VLELGKEAYCELVAVVLLLALEIGVFFIEGGFEIYWEDVFL